MRFSSGALATEGSWRTAAMVRVVTRRVADVIRRTGNLELSVWWANRGGRDTYSRRNEILPHHLELLPSGSVHV